MSSSYGAMATDPAGTLEERLESMESLLRQVATQQTLEKIETKVDKMSAHSSKLFGMMQGGHNGA